MRDQLPEEGGRDYGRGFWAQQWLGLKRLAGRDKIAAAPGGGALPPGGATMDIAGQAPAGGNQG